LLLRVGRAEPASLQWLSGFAARVAHERASGGGMSLPAVQAQPSARLAIVYGSQTGNGKRIAERLARAAEAAGIAARAAAAGAYPLKDSPRNGCWSYHEHARRRRSARRRAWLPRVHCITARPKLEQLSYAVLALGDSSYPRLRNRPPAR
jgi:sulfite reductase (NADPH) flavoprotein alpha-component